VEGEQVGDSATNISLNYSTFIGINKGDSKGKVVPVDKYVPHHDNVWGSGGIAPCILKPWHQMEVSVQLHALATLPQGRNTSHPLDWGLGGPQSQSG
jgi:hypothetical protein